MCAHARTHLCASVHPPPPLTHTHTGTGTRTHKHSDYTNLNLNSIKRAANRDLILMKTERERERDHVYTPFLSISSDTRSTFISLSEPNMRRERSAVHPAMAARPAKLPAKFLTQKVNTVVRSPTKQTAWVSMWTLQVTVYLHSPSSHSHN